jgi:hypothetical protein
MLAVHIGLVQVVSFLLLDFRESLLFREKINASDQLHRCFFSHYDRLLNCLVMMLGVIILKVFHTLDIAV